MAQRRDEDVQSGGGAGAGGGKEGVWERVVAERGGRVLELLVAFGRRWGEDKI